MMDETTHTVGRRSVLKALGAVGLFGSASGVTAAMPAEQSGARPQEFLVGIAPSTSIADAQSQVQRDLPNDAEVVSRNETLGYMTVRLPDKASTQTIGSVRATLEDRPAVEYTEDNTVHHAFAIPSDPSFGEQYAPQQVSAPTAWETTLGSADVTVAVVDQGLKYDHPDIEAQIGAEAGRDFVDDDYDPYPDSLVNEIHGTHVSGIASATTDNATGVAGMSNSTLLSGRALSELGSGSTADIADAIQWAADQGANIVNLSLGGGGYTETMKTAVAYATDNGALVIAAAGNDYGASVSYPAAYEECVAVSAVDQNEEFASFSNNGPNVDVAAPGVDVLSTWTDDGYRRISGTSMACPAASGVAALGLAADPNLSVSELRARLEETAVDIGLSSDEQGSGRVDATNIVE